MSQTTDPLNDSPGGATPGQTEQSPSRRRVLLYAAAPVVLLILLMTGVRFATDAAHQREQTIAADDRQRLLALRPSAPGARPTPIPVVTYAADKATQAALERVVRGQVEAIGKQDFEKALAYAMPDIRKNTQPARFGDMIRRGYAGMLGVKEITVEPARIQKRAGGDERQAFLQVEVLTATGTRARFGYILMGGPDGWEVAGVVPDYNTMRGGGGGGNGLDENAVPLPRQNDAENFRDL